MVAVAQRELRPHLYLHTQESERLNMAILQEGVNWANRPYFMTEWLRTQGRSYHGQPVGEVIQGLALNSILGDDVFFPEMGGMIDKKLIQGNEAAQRMARGWQENEVTRLSWEVGLEELPVWVRQELGEILQDVEYMDWANPDDAQRRAEAYQRWKGLKQHIAAQVQEDPDLTQATKKSDLLRPAINADFNRFVAQLQTP